MSWPGFPGGLEIETPPDQPVIRFRRAVRAAPAVVFAAWTEPDQLRRWWGPADWTLVVCEVDLRVGGGYRFVRQDRDGPRYGTRGTYLRIEPGADHDNITGELTGRALRRHHAPRRPVMSCARGSGASRPPTACCGWRSG